MKKKKQNKDEEDTGIDPEILEIMEKRRPIKVNIGLGTLILGRLLFGKFSK